MKPENRKMNKKSKPNPEQAVQGNSKLIEHRLLRQKFASFVGTATSIGFDRQMSREELLREIQAFWSSDAGKANMISLMEGAWRYSGEQADRGVNRCISMEVAHD